MKKSVRSLAWRLAPERMADRAVRWNRASRARRGAAAAEQAYADENGLTVQAGPFRDLRYPEGSPQLVDALVEKLEGRYESVLHPIIGEVLLRRPTMFIDIGVSDGYYAIGMARAGIPVVGFEPASEARSVAAQVAHANDVQIDLRGVATSARVRRIRPHQAFVLSDCEGAEARIFDEKLVIGLRTSVVVVETHEWAAPGVEGLLRGRFAATHDLEVVVGNDRSYRDDIGRWFIFRPQGSARLVKAEQETVRS